MLEGKPLREPDYIDYRGIYFWFKEMVYLHPQKNIILPLEEDKEGQIVMMQSSGGKSWHTTLPLNEHYKKWSIAQFESIVLGAEYDTREIQDTTVEPKVVSRRWRNEGDPAS
jgi:hypothetical protein